MPYDMLEHIAPTQGQMYPLIGAGSNETCRTRVLSSGYRYFDKNENWEELWGDDNFVYRAFDISNYRNGDVYAIHTMMPNGYLRYGCAWLDRYMEIGQIFPRHEYVIKYRASDGHILSQDAVTTYAKLVDYRASMTFPSGRTVQNVALLQYGFSPDVSDVKETYHYGKGFGLVGFEDGVMATYIGQGTPTTIKPQTVIPWIDVLRPPVPPKEQAVTPPPVIVIPPNKGTPKAMQTNATAGVKHRADGDTSAAVLRTLSDKTPVTAYPDTAKPNDGYTWFFCETAAGEPGWCASEYLVAVAPPEPPSTVTLTEAQAEAMDDYLARAIDDMTAARQILKEAAASSGGNFRRD